MAGALGEARHEPHRPRAGVRPFYALMMFPYPSAEGLHVGNLFAFTGNDIYGRFQRLQGHTVFEPLGFDAFGIHSENYALKVGMHPSGADPQEHRQLPPPAEARRADGRLAPRAVDHRSGVLQVDAVGLPAAVQARAGVQEAGGGQLVPERQDRARQRAGHRRRVRAVRRQGRAAVPRAVVLPHHRLRRRGCSTNLDWLDWSETTKTAQRNWIGRSDGAEITFRVQDLEDRAAWRRSTRRERRVHVEPIDIRVFTTRPDTIFGATYLVLAPEHPLVDALTTPTSSATRSRRTASAAAKQDIVTRKTTKEKTGVFTGAYAINPATGKPIPIWIADYVLMEYGTGAIMAVPGHDERDFEFANVVRSADRARRRGRGRRRATRRSTRRSPRRRARGS